jgi:hypothetical protein
VTDPDLVLKKLAVIETCVRELRQLARLDALVDDIKERRFVDHTLQLAIQAALDVASHIVSDDRLGELGRIGNSSRCPRAQAGYRATSPLRCGRWPVSEMCWCTGTTSST